MGAKLSDLDYKVHENINMKQKLENTENKERHKKKTINNGK